MKLGHILVSWRFLLTREVFYREVTWDRHWKASATENSAREWFMLTKFLAQSWASYLGWHNWTEGKDLEDGLGGNALGAAGSQLAFLREVSLQDKAKLPGRGWGRENHLANRAWVIKQKLKPYPPLDFHLYVSKFFLFLKPYEINIWYLQLKSS